MSAPVRVYSSRRMGGDWTWVCSRCDGGMLPPVWRHYRQWHRAYIDGYIHADTHMSPR